MKKQTAPAMTVLSKVVKTTLEDLIKNIENFPKEIVQEAVNAGLHPSGPQYWIYKWETCVTVEEFELKICLPVATFGNSFTSDKFKLEKLEEYVHVKKTHLGPWDQMMTSYETITEEMKAENIEAGKTCRELYINCDFEAPENNITEIQFQVN
jgi:effector-binding domain-containing protein